MIKNFIGHSINDIYWYVLPATLPSILICFGLSYKTIGGLITIYLGIIAFLSLLMGNLADLFPREKIIGIGFILASIGFILASFVHSLSLFILFIVLAAFGVSTFHPAAYSLIGKIDKKGEAYGKFEAFGIFGILIMYLIYGFLLKYLNWNGILLFTGIPGIINGPFFLKGNNVASTNSHISKLSDHGENNAANFLNNVIYLFIGIALRIFSITSIISFIPTYLVQELYLSPSLANYFASFIFLGGTITAIFSGKLSDRYNPMLLIIIFSLLTIPVIFFIGVFKSFFILAFLLILLGGCWIGFFPPQNRILIILGKNSGKGHIFGILTAVITFTNAIGPGIFGLLADNVGILKTINIFAIPALFGFVVLLSIYKKLNINSNL